MSKEYTKDMAYALPSLLGLEVGAYAKAIGVSLATHAEWRADKNYVPPAVARALDDFLSAKKMTPMRACAAPFVSLGFKLGGDDEDFVDLEHKKILGASLEIRSDVGYQLSDSRQGTDLPGWFAFHEWRACRDLLSKILARKLKVGAAEILWVTEAPGTTAEDVKFIKKYDAQIAKEENDELRAASAQAKGIAALKAKAKKNDPVAQYNLGRALIKGRHGDFSVAVDEKAGRRWLERAAAQPGATGKLAQQVLDALDSGDRFAKYRI